MRNRKILVALALIAALTLGNVMAVSAAHPVDGPWSHETDNNRVGFHAVERNDNDIYYPQNDNDELNDTANDNDNDANDRTGQGGLFRLDVVPQFNFGLDHNILTRPTTFNGILPRGVVADATAARDIPYFVQVTDDRGTHVGWHLTVEFIRQFGDPAGAPAAGSADLHPAILERMGAYSAATPAGRNAALNPMILTGSTVTLSNIASRTNTVFIDDPGGPINPIPVPRAAPAVRTAPAVLSPGTAIVLASTTVTGTPPQTDQGLGVSSIRFGNVVDITSGAAAPLPANHATPGHAGNTALSSVQLFVPATLNVMSGIYTASFRWTLTTGPAAAGTFN